MFNCPCCDVAPKTRRWPAPQGGVARLLQRQQRWRGWMVEEKARKEETGLKSRHYFGKLLLKDKQAQTSHLSLRNRPHLGNCRLSLGGLQS